MHPFYGSTAGSPRHALNTMPPRQRREDTVVVGLLGGSVADDVKPYLQVALNRWFAANQLPRRPAVFDLALGGSKQPTQTMIVTNTLLLGGEFDLIVNLDGFNELNSGALQKVRPELFPGRNRRNRAGAEFLRAGRLRALRGEQARRAAAGATSPLRGSALFGLANRYRRERNTAEIIRLSHQLATAEVDYNLERHGPRSRGRNTDEMMLAAARFWQRGALMMRRLAELAGADYYHFLQPNQYVPGSKPLSAQEREFAWRTDASEKAAVEQGYPLLRELNRELQSQGINYFDLTGIFAGHRETLYRDTCCHVNDAGNELLAAEMVRLMTPALARRGGPRQSTPVSVLAAARRPPASAALLEPSAPPGHREFQVSFSEDGKELRYVREDCAPADTDPAFFLHLLPRDAADLPPRSREQGLENRDFVFWEAGGRFEGQRCVAQIPLPDYPIAALRTGQHIPGQEPLWSVELIIPADPEQLRADYAALSVEQPAARSDFALYIQDNQLIYLRESCTAADTTAPFFLHIFPEDVTDLPADWQAVGFTHGGFDFARQGGRFDGKCLAAVALPDYPIKEMRTGQHIPGQGPLWSARLTAAPDYDQLRADYAALSKEQPVAQDVFDLYSLGHRLIYLRETCSVEDTAAAFFLHIVPEEITDLPAERRDAGFAPWGFDFAHRGGRFDGKCLATVALPDYPIKEMRTGQYVQGQGNLWSVELIAAPDYDQLRADYAALSAVEPAARDYFDLYRREGRLIYLRESCTAADMAASFFLHIVPEDVADLPAERRAAGFAHGNFDFVRQGGRFDGNCLAAVILPDYPIAALRTGQYVPGQGDLWSVDLVLAP